MDSQSKRYYEDNYAKITKFYDLAEELIDSVENTHNGNPHKQISFIEPLVKQVECAIDTIAEEYREFVRKGKKPGLFARRRIERALSDIYEVVTLCKEIQNKDKKTDK